MDTVLLLICVTDLKGQFEYLVSHLRLLRGRILLIKVLVDKNISITLDLVLNTSFEIIT